MTQPTTNNPSTDLTLRWLAGRYAICRLEPHEVIPPWAVNTDGLLSVTRTEDELSVLVCESDVPPNVPHEPGWSAMLVVGRLDFALVGILARLTASLAAAKIPVFAISTHDTDYLLVKAEQRDHAEQALAGVAQFVSR